MSDSVERFTTSCCEYGDDVATPKDDGWLVRYEDYERLRACLAAAERVVEAAIAECEQPDVVKSHALWQEILAYRAALATPTTPEDA